MISLFKHASMAVYCAAAIVLAGTDALADEGGVKDTTGLIWSQSQKVETNSWWTWTSAITNAANYWVADVDAAGQPTVYDDWRLPTKRELQAAILDGTMTGLMPLVQQYTSDGVPLEEPQYWQPYYYKAWIWTSETKGTKAWAVQVVREEIYPYWLVKEASGATELQPQKSTVFSWNANEVFFVRGKAPLK